MSVVESSTNNNTRYDLKVDLDKPRWNQTTFMGRLKHFAAITDVRKLIASEHKLDQAKELVTLHRSGLCPPGTTEEQLWQAKHLYDSAFHPDTGDKMNLFGRMTFQVPGGMAITGLLLHFYRTPAEVALMQWLNQSFNVLVNYTNRNAASQISTSQMLMTYATATGAALSVAIGLNTYAKRASPIVARWVPFVAVATANAVNIPLSRQSELISGVKVTDVDGNELGSSKKCARKGISQVVFSRIFMAAPGMIFLPMIMENLNKRSWFRRIKWFHLPFQTLGVGAFLLCTVPVGCALFPQRASMKVEYLEDDLRLAIKSRYGDSINKVYFNKGL